MHGVIKPRRRRRYGRNKELKKKVKAAAKELCDDNVVLADKFGMRCIVNVPDVTTDGPGLWNEMNRLASSIFRKKINQMEPLSSYEQKLMYKVTIQMSTSPDTIRSSVDLSQCVNRKKLEEIISKAKMIMQRVHRSNPQVQREFFEGKENLIRDLKAMNDATVLVNETENVRVIQTKINDIIGPLLCDDVDENTRNKFLSQLMANPRAFETSDLITQSITNSVDVMRKIKSILDEHMTVRPGKRFYIPIHRIIDVPFAVAVREKSGRLTEENAKILREALTVQMEGVISQIKPKIIDPKFTDIGTLTMVCANRMTFNTMKTIIANDFNGKWTGADLIVDPMQIKRPLSRSQLKTVLLKFTEPQFSHFNHLMEQLKIDNPSLLVRRWELHQPPKGQQIDSTECLYVGVDMESLGTIEQMNRIAVLSKSTVMFEICYDDSEGNYLPDHSLLTQ